MSSWSCLVVSFRSCGFLFEEESYPHLVSGELFFTPALPSLSDARKRPKRTKLLQFINSPDVDMCILRCVCLCVWGGVLLCVAAGKEREMEKGGDVSQCPQDVSSF